MDRIHYMKKEQFEKIKSQVNKSEGEKNKI